MDEEFLQFAPNLKFIARSGSGLENIAIPYCEKRKIALFNSPEGNRNAVAEHALAMLLSMLNQLPKANREVHQGLWNREGNRGEELDGKTIGIIGYGNNGSAFAKKLRGFDVKILAYDKYKTNFGDNQVIEATLEAIFNQADVISFHIPQTEETLHFADELFFNKFSKPIYLLNLSRGKIVKTAALVEALRNGKIKGAGLDVLEFEKSSFEDIFDQQISTDFHYILAQEKVILTPHVGGWTNESYYKLSDVLADKILKHFDLVE
jgi:D-3-phosphoglycerate dehydrogenase